MLSPLNSIYTDWKDFLQRLVYSTKSPLYFITLKSLRAAGCSLYAAFKAFLTTSLFDKSSPNCQMSCKSKLDHFIFLLAYSSGFHIFPIITCFNSVMSNVTVKLPCYFDIQLWFLLERGDINIYLRGIFIGTLEFFSSGQITQRTCILHPLSIRMLCISPCEPALRLHLIPLLHWGWTLC